MIESRLEMKETIRCRRICLKNRNDVARHRAHLKPLLE